MNERVPSILIVDDDPDARLIMRAALRKIGFDVRVAEGGHEALAQFRAQPSDLVMLDVEMPDLGGHEVCATLRREFGALLPIVMVTGMDDVQSVETAYQHGATDFISKPVNWALIGHRVRYLLRSHRAMVDLGNAERRHAAVLNAIPDLLFEIDHDGRFHDFRAPDTGLLAVPPEAIIGRTMETVLPPPAVQVCRQALDQALQHGSSVGLQYAIDLPRGNTWFELSVARKHGEPGSVPRFIVLSRDITERKEAEARIARLAYYDSLTGLPNRQSFLERVDQEVRRARQNRKRLATLFMDLDGFKNINDTLGHAAGDLVLQWAAERLRESLRPADVLSRPVGLDLGDDVPVQLARLGGDEFTALILDIDHADEALAVAHRIGQMMRRPFILEGREITLTTSIGIAMYPEDGADGATLLKHADTAMYHAKSSGRDNTQLYSTSLTEELLQRMEIDASLRAALDRRQFEVVYQPQIDAASGRIRSLEALIRWNHPARGAISPLDFIPLAEENGLIERIGEWVLRTACEDAVAFNRIAGRPVGMAVNLSPLQTTTPALPQRVRAILSDVGLPANLLELEITEGALMDNAPATRAVLQALREMGVTIALDDFGTGYSSLSYLTRLPIGNIKIDRSFIAGLLGGGESEAIVRAVLAMAGGLGLRVTAEGVENIDQAQALRALQCHCLQGYWFSKPVPAAAIPELLHRRWHMADVTATSFAPLGMTV